MIEYKCKNCGGKIVVEDGTAICVCDSCGATFDLHDEKLEDFENIVVDTVRETENRIIEAVNKQNANEINITEAMIAAEEKRYNQKIVNWLAAAKNYLEDSKFSDASEVYKEILKESPQCAEAYIGLFMAKNNITSFQTMVDKLRNQWREMINKARNATPEKFIISSFQLTKESLLELCDDVPKIKMIKSYLDSYQNIENIALQHTYREGALVLQQYMPPEFSKNDSDYKRAVQFSTPELQTRLNETSDMVDKAYNNMIKGYEAGGQKLREQQKADAKEKLIVGANEYDKKVKKELKKNLLITLLISILFMGSSIFFFISIPTIFFLLIRKKEYGIKQGLKVPNIKIAVISLVGMAIYILLHISKQNFTNELLEGIQMNSIFLIVVGIIAILIRRAKNRLIDFYNDLKR